MEYDRLRQQLSESKVSNQPFSNEDQETTAQVASDPVSSEASRKPARRSKRSRGKSGKADRNLENRTTANDQRHMARQLALLALFELDLTDHDFDEVIARAVEAPFLSDPDSDEPSLLEQTNLEITIPEEALRDHEALEKRVRTLVMGVVSNVEAIDAVLQQAAPALPIEQIAAVDRNALRIGIYQLLHDETVPEFAAVNESVELAKRFGGEKSASFVNGVLRTVQQSKSAEPDAKPSGRKQKGNSSSKNRPTDARK